MRMRRLLKIELSGRDGSAYEPRSYFESVQKLDQVSALRFRLDARGRIKEALKRRIFV